MKNFKIIVEINDELTIFESFKTNKRAIAYIDSIKKDGKAKSVKMYELNEKLGAYELMLDIIHKSTVEEVKPVGFGRW